MPLLKCPKCKKKISDSALFCPKCDHSLKIKVIECPDCKNLVSDQKSSCPECGRLLKVEAQITTPSSAESKLELIEFLMKQTESNDRKVDGYKKDLDKTIGWWVGIFGAIAFIIVTIAGVLGYREYNDIKKEIESFRKEINQELTKEKETFKKEFEKFMSTLEIKLIVQETAKQYSNQAIEDFISKRFDEKILPFINKASKEIDILSTQFTMLRLSENANAGLFDSFKLLEDYTNSPTEDIRSMANIQYKKILLELDKFKNTIPSGFMYPISLMSGEIELPLSKFDLPTIYCHMHLWPKDKIQASINYILSDREIKSVYQTAREAFLNSNNLFVKAAFGVAVAELHRKETGQTLLYLPFNCSFFYNMSKLCKIKLDNIYKNEKTKR